MGLEQAKQKLEDLEARYEQLGQQMLDPAVTADSTQYVQVSKTWSDLTEVVETYRAYKKALADIRSSEELLADSEMRELAQADLELLKPRKEEIEARLKLLLLPKDPYDDKNVILEIRPAAGGEEAALFS